MFNSLLHGWRSSLSPQQTLKVAKLQLQAASSAEDDAVALVFCEQAEIYLDRVKRPKSLSATESADFRAFREEIAAAYSEHASFMDNWECIDKAQASRSKSEKWRGAPVQKIAIREFVPFPKEIFDTDDARPTTVPCEVPEVNKPLTETRQLAYCLAALNTAKSPEVEFPAATREWVQAIENDQDEQKRLRELAKSLVRVFAHDLLKDADAIAEVTSVAPFLEKADFRFLIKLFINSLMESVLLDIHMLEGMAQLLGSTSGTIEADDLVKTLHHLSIHLQGTHNQSQEYLYRLTTTFSRLLDAMADCYVMGIVRESLHEPAHEYLEHLKGSDDPYLVYQAAYAFQAILFIPDDESPCQAVLQRMVRSSSGGSGMVNAAKGVDVNSYIEGLCMIQTALGEIYDMASKINGSYEDAKSLYGNGRELKVALQNVSFDRRRAWYIALRCADTLLSNGHLAEFKKLVCEAPCRRALAFQWGVCLRLGNLAVDSQWDDKHRRGAVAFLGHLYRDDDHWGHHVLVRQLILDILMQLSISSQSVAQAEAEALLGELNDDGDSAKRAMFQSCLASGPSPHPLIASKSPPSTSALLDRAQGKVDVETDLTRLKRESEQRRVKAVYIPPMAKASLQTPDAELFDLQKKADYFLAHEEQKVLLLLGESGIGKSTFNMELEHQLWKVYEKHKGRIPLLISLPTVHRPEQDLIAKQLRKLQFEEPQIRELKKRKFVLICDGYDESQQTHNLYTENQLNQEGGWQAQMIISCRSEYVDLDYKDLFQPGDRDQSSSPGQFQEAVVMPFNEDQIEGYIKGFVNLENPLWSAENYCSVLENITSLRDLVKNPLLLKLSLEALPQLADSGQEDLAAIKLTRVTLYDYLVEQWLERGKRRLAGKTLSEQETRALQSLSGQGFTRNGIAFLKRLAVDIYDKQDGNPVIEYSSTEDEGSWKHKYFGQDDNIQLLREACPLTKSGNQYRFVHQSILEYGVARAVFEPQSGGAGVEKTEPLTSTLRRRGSVKFAKSFEIEGALHDIAVTNEQGPDLESLLARRRFVRDPSVLQFLVERAQQEPVFRKQLLAYIDASKGDNKWRIVASNAISILLRTGEQFNGVCTVLPGAHENSSKTPSLRD
ncbi:hypothetical protein BGZ67_009317 [Mortierella alpina]|nr:hypothetical protein BGZ67_009317 [Mortierella alpina]